MDKEIVPPSHTQTPSSASPLPPGNANKAIPDEDAIRAGIVAAARKYLGIPYKLGAPVRPATPPEPAPLRLDCSGFIAQVYKEVTGVTIPRTSRIMFEQGKMISQSELKPGDIIVMDSDSRDFDNGVNHVAMYIGPDVVYQALSTGPRTGVVQTKFPGISTAKVLGYRTFIGTTSGDKQAYTPTSVTDYSFDLTPLPNSEAMELELQTSSMLRFIFSNQTGKPAIFTYRFLRDGTNPNTGENESFNLKPGETFQSNLCFPKTPAKYHLQVYTGSFMLLERTWMVTN
jgi:hypothetical protein